MLFSKISFRNFSIDPTPVVDSVVRHGFIPEGWSVLVLNSTSWQGMSDLLAWAEQNQVSPRRYTAKFDASMKKLIVGFADIVDASLFNLSYVEN